MSTDEKKVESRSSGGFFFLPIRPDVARVDTSVMNRRSTEARNCERRMNLKRTIAISLINDGDINRDLAIVGGNDSVPLARRAALGQVDQVECCRQTGITAAQDENLERLSLGRVFKLGSHGVWEG